MKKVYLMKGMAAMALGLVVASCNKFDAFNPYAEQEAKQQEFTENFQTSVMNGQTIDQNQTWATTTPVQVSVTPRTTGTLKIYTANPIGNVVASLYTADVTAGTKTTFTVAKPADVSELYAVVINTKGLIADQLAFDATESSVAIDLNITTSNSNRAARRTAPTKPSVPELDETNPIQEPSEPENVPTKSTSGVNVISESSSNEFYLGGDRTYYIESNVTLSKVTGIGDRCKVYMASKSKIEFTSTPYLKTGTLIYNDGGEIVANEGLNFDNAGVLWNKGTIDLKTKDIYYGNDGGIIYNVGTITNVKNFTVGQGGMLWNEGSITASGTLSGYNSNSKIYNAANCTITAGGLLLNNTSQYMWNDGTLKINGAVSFTNCVAKLVNNGRLEAESFDGSAGGCFHNMTDKVVVISGATNMTNSNAIWVNDGTYTTETFKVQGGSNPVFNNCRLTVTDKFTMGSNDGSRFILNAYASVICDDFDWNGDNYFLMGGNSLLLVNNTLLFNNNNTDKGFFQYGDDYSVISAKAITTDDTTNDWAAWYEGKIYVDADSHFDQYIINDGQRSIYIGEGVVFTNKQFTAPVPDAWKTETTCRPAYNPGEQREDEIAWYYYAFEDLGTTDDFDFNDVIIRVSAPVDNVSTVQLVAAGGTLATTVLYNEQVFNATEVHELFGTTPSNSGMVNTGNGPEKKFVTLGTVTLTANDDPADLPFGISAQGTNGQLTKVTHSVENIGKAPLVIVVAGYPSGDNAGRWFWPTERTMISAAYTDFGAWGANASSYQNWYTNYDSDKVYQWDDSKEQ